MKRILIASPVRQKPAILREFLAGLEALDTEGLEINYVFTPDNDPLLDEFEFTSDRLLKDFIDRHHGIFIYPVSTWPYHHKKYICDEENHYWTNDLVQKVAAYKNTFISECLDGDYDYLFLVDSDIVLHPHTLTHLVSLGKDIVSEVFWTRWEPNAPPLPNVWKTGAYLFHRQWSNEKLPNAEAERQTMEFLNMLKKPGTYPVGGLGACTLISRKALEAGVSFAAIDNVDYWGEDRHFCIRARVLGLELWADTHYLPYHIYRESELPGLALWRDRQRERGSRITVGMLVRNEAGRYLEQVLEQVKMIADSIVILDDASDDDTIDICRRTINAKYYYTGSETETIYGTWGESDVIICNHYHGFNNEVELRKELWKQMHNMGGEWFMILDADELLEPRALEEIRRLAADPEAEAYAFRLFDMWGPDHYRDDALWNAHRRPWPLMVRYIPGREYVWNEQPLHCGRLPANVLDGLVVKDSGLRVKHMGWARPEDRQEKAERYARLDPEAKHGIQAQYDSILDPSPTLRPWQDEEKRPTISLCMIVRDEERNLPRCLESVRGVVDEIIVVDTGSTHATINLLGKFGHDWLAPELPEPTPCPVGPGPQFSGTIGYSSPDGRRFLLERVWWSNDFSASRNASLELAHGDWILVLDADEELSPASRDMLRDLVTMAPPEVQGYLVTCTSVLGSEDGWTEKNQDLIFRLFRNRPEYRFRGAVHEQIMDSIQEANPGQVCFVEAREFEIFHHGYTQEQVAAKDKERRNLEMFEANPPADDDLLRHYQYGVELMRAGRWDDAIRELIAATRGADTRQIFLPKLIRGLVMSLKEGGQPEKALDLVRLGVRLFPEYADLYYYGGLLCHGDRSEVAARDFYLAALYAPGQPPHYSSYEGVTSYRARYQLGNLAEQHGRYGGARQWYEETLTDCPQFEEARQALARLETLPDMSGVSDWELLSLYLSTLQPPEGTDGVMSEDGRVWRGLTAEGLGRIIEGRGE